MTVRKGMNADIPKIGALWLALVNEITPRSRPNLAWWLDDTFDLMDYEAGYLCYVAEEAGDIIGFTDGVVMKDPGMGKVVFYSRHTSIVPEHRHGETVKELFGAISRDARAQGAESAVFCCDNSLIGYWQGIGYKQIEAVMEGSLYGNG